VKYLTKKEVAEVLRVSVRTITDYMSKGLLPAPKRLGRILLWDEDELIGAVSSINAGREGAPASSRASRGRPRKVVF
jgi:excisionase family DNA binding protein